MSSFNFLPEPLATKVEKLFAKEKYSDVWPLVSKTELEQDWSETESQERRIKLCLKAFATEDIKFIQRSVCALPNTRSFELLEASVGPDYIKNLDPVFKKMYLLEKRSSQRVANADIYHAVMFGNVVRVQEALLIGANLNARNDAHTTLAHLAAEDNHPGVLEYLLNYQPPAHSFSNPLDINAPTKYGVHPIECAAKYLLEKLPAKKSVSSTCFILLLEHYKENLEQLRQFESQLQQTYGTEPQIKELLRPYIEREVIRQNLFAVPQTANQTAFKNKI